MRVKNHFDENPPHQPDNSEIMDYTNYQTDKDIQYIAGLLSGIRYHPVKHFGIFFEGGLGTVGNISFGISSKF